MAAPVTVYGPAISPAVARVAACLLEKDVAFQLEAVDMSKGEHKSPSFLKLQPFGQVPAFKDHLTTVFGRLAIAFQLTFAPLMGMATDMAVVEQNEAKLAKVLDVYERRLAESQYFAGDEFTLADLVHMPNTDLLVSKTGKAGLITERKNLSRWWDEVSARPSWKKLAFAPLLEIPQDHMAIAENERKLQQVLNVYDEILSKNEYLAGDEFTLADLSHLPDSQYIVSSERGRKLFTSRRNVARWFDKISRRKAWEQVVKMQMEHPGAFE
ncbi:Glutathione S-transferase [Triticum urartu]|uniref:glutathione transferase n=2 Tax=Triticum TaxID=4564 RepID=A0A9R0WUZ4_TRITD|nr:Glutathione S-transferase [Triticum urartu]VAI24817.1 unnamed protein product [Triticum turgidum subsp. durum]